MAAEEIPTSSAVAPAFTGVLSSPPPTSAISPLSADLARARSLKRSRPESQNPANLTSIANAGLRTSPVPKSPRYVGSFSPKFASPAPLTGAAALADERRRLQGLRRLSFEAVSENPAKQALSSLMAGGGVGMSRPQDAPTATTAMSEGMSAVANAITIPSPLAFAADKDETSPASVTSMASLGSMVQTATTSTTAAGSPANAASLEPRFRDAGGGLAPPAIAEDRSSNRALTLPGNMHLPSSELSRGSARGYSLPMPGQGQPLAPRSPSQKKHKCPYCETEFTRHHNLKSHLLTHSQEKPYVCQTCQMRFRRLHDLKRHTKLHTGERPHICPKCDRKFARGDALARHSKGQGGCAGRRASVGSLDGNDDFDDSHAADGESGMEGIMYTEGGDDNGSMSDGDQRRFSLPVIKAQHVAGSHAFAQSRGHSTYPPPGLRPTQQQSGGLYPPQNDHTTSSSSGTSPSLQARSPHAHTSNTSVTSMPMTGGSMFSQGGITESPKPLSPAGMTNHQLGHGPPAIARDRSPSLATQFQQQHFGRRQSGRSSPPGMALPSPHAMSHGAKLPSLSLPGLAPPESRFTLSSQTPSQQQQQQQQNGLSSQATSQAQTQGPTNAMYQTHPQAPQRPAGDSAANVFAGGERGVWNYVQSLEDKVKALSERVAMLEGAERTKDDRIRALEGEVGGSRHHMGQ